MRVLTKVYTDNPLSVNKKKCNLSDSDNSHVGTNSPPPTPPFSRPAGKVTGGPTVSPDVPTLSSDSLPNLVTWKIAVTPSQWDISERLKDLAYARQLLPDEAIASCQFDIAPLVHRLAGDRVMFETPNVEVLRNPDRQTAHYLHLQRCKSPSCPWCAPAWAEDRRREISAGLKTVQENGHSVAFLTLTISHSRKDALKNLLKKFRKVIGRLLSGKAGKKLKIEYGIYGDIQALETPYGVNGWHLHLHILLISGFALSPGQVANLENVLKTQYLKLLAKYGLSADWEHGLTLKIGDSAIAEYMAKFGKDPKKAVWGVEHEITKNHAKRGKNGSLSPFQLLRAARGGIEELRQLEGITGIHDLNRLKTLAGELYIEFFDAFKGRTRAKWSNGLKSLLRVEEQLLTLDTETQTENPEYPVVVIEDGWNGWNRVIYNESGDLRGELLERVAAGDLVKLAEWLDKRQIPGKITEIARQVAAGDFRQLAPKSEELPQNRYEICGKPGFEGLPADDQRDHEKLPPTSCPRDELPRLADPPGANPRRRAVPPGGGWRLVAGKGL